MNHAYRLAAALAVILISTAGAQARHRHHYQHHSHPIERVSVGCDYDNNGRVHCDAGAVGVVTAQAYAGDGEIGTVVGGRPPGCPHAFCGCGVSLKVFGRIVPELNLAANWYRFPRTSAAAGMVAIFGRHHVALILSTDGNGNATLYDPNSGGHRTHIHQRSIARATIVNPHAARYAQK